MTIARLSALLDASFIDHEMDEDGNLCITNGLDFPVCVRIDARGGAPIEKAPPDRSGGASCIRASVQEADLDLSSVTDLADVAVDGGDPL